MTLLFGALLGFISIAFGAFAEHGLRHSITEEEFRFLMTAIRYNQLHAALLVAIGLARLQSPRMAALASLTYAVAGFLAGTVMFSFSIYASVCFGIRQLVAVTPVGGMTLMVAWLMLAYAGYRLGRRI